MSLIQSIQKYLPLGRKPTLPRGETLALRPVRNRIVSWEQPEDSEEEGLHLRVPRRQDKIGVFLSRWLAYPSHKIIELDEFGAAIWQRCDGRTTVDQLVAYTSLTHKLNRRQAEVSVVAFLKMLTQRRLIGFIASETPPSSATKEKETYGHSRPQRQRQFRRAAWRRH